MLSFVGDKCVGFLVFVFSFVDLNFVWVNEVVVNWGMMFFFEMRVVGCVGLDSVELNRELDGDVDVLVDYFFDDVGDDGDNMIGDKYKLFREVDKLLIGLKYCVFGLNVCFVVWILWLVVLVLLFFLLLYKILI